MNSKALFLAVVAALFVCLSCIDTKKASLTKFTKRTIVPIETIDGRWRVTEINGRLIESKMEEPSLDFTVGESRVSGFTSCNRLLGSFNYDSTQPETIRFGSLGTTMMACPEENVEAEFLDAMNRVNRFGALESETGILLLTDSLNTPLMVLRR